MPFPFMSRPPLKKKKKKKKNAWSQVTDELKPETKIEILSRACDPPMVQETYMRKGQYTVCAGAMVIRAWISLRYGSFYNFFSSTKQGKPLRIVEE